MAVTSTAARTINKRLTAIALWDLVNNFLLYIIISSILKNDFATG
jgi:hypothetical protein